MQMSTQNLPGMTQPAAGLRERRNQRVHACMRAQIFFAAVGASGEVRAVITTAPALFLFCFAQIGVHLALILGAGRALGFTRRELLLASNANVGGKNQNLLLLMLHAGIRPGFEQVLPVHGVQGPPQRPAWRQPRDGGRAWCQRCSLAHSATRAPLSQPSD
jgi:hypothetical protein